MKSILIVEEEKEFNDFLEYKQIIEKNYNINEFENLYFVFLRLEQINHYVCTFLKVKNDYEIKRQDIGNFLSIEFNKEISELLFKDFRENDISVILYKNQFCDVANQIDEKLKNLKVSTDKINLSEVNI